MDGNNLAAAQGDREGLKARHRSALAMSGAVVLLLAVALVLTASLSIRASLSTLRDSGSQLLDLYQKVLQSELQRHAYLPLTLSRNRDVVTLLEQPAQPLLQDDLNRYLEQVSAGTDALAVYVLDRHGTTLASSNWRTATSYVGHNYSFRPYFQSALRGQRSHYFAIGATTGIPGLFISDPVVQAGRVIGVVAIKVSMKPLEQAWAANGHGVVALSDQHGVIFSSSRGPLQFHTLQPLDAATRAQLASSRKYSDRPLPSLRLQPVSFWGFGGSELVVLQPDPAPAAEPIQGRYLLQQRPLEGTRWTLSLLSELKPVKARLATSLMVAFSLLMVAVMAVIFVWQARANRQQRAHLERLAQEALIRANDVLEQRVAARTRELEATQHELIQAGKLAALGQMSAGIAHELNQPLAALRTFASSGVLLIERQQYEKARGNFERINTLAERIGRLTGQLKVLARQDHRMPVAVDLAPAIGHALEVTQHVQAARGIRFQAPPGESVPPVLADQLQLEQVLINLLSNALDAVQGAADPRISIEVAREGDRVVLSVRDNGCGVALAHLPHLFDPFFTTKEVGQGLGLGLSLANGMVRGWGGEIRVEPLAAGVAVHVSMQYAAEQE